MGSCRPQNLGLQPAAAAEGQGNTSVDVGRAIRSNRDRRLDANRLDLHFGLDSLSHFVEGQFFRVAGEGLLDLVGKVNSLLPRALPTITIHDAALDAAVVVRLVAKIFAEKAAGPGLEVGAVVISAVAHNILLRNAGNLDHFAIEPLPLAVPVTGREDQVWRQRRMNDMVIVQTPDRFGNQLVGRQGEGALDGGEGDNDSVRLHIGS